MKVKRQKHQLGNYLQIQFRDKSYEAMIPVPLPPVPPLEWDDRLLCEFEDASLRIGALDALFNSLPEKHVVAKHHRRSEAAALHLNLSKEMAKSLLIRSEAVYSSQIEGTQSNLADVLMDERGEKPSSTKEDVREVRNCLEAYQLALENPNQHISVEFLLEIHEKLMQHAPEKSPGKFRDKWVTIGNRHKIAFVPPPHDEVERCMQELVEFIENSRMPSLVTAALAHAQFEIIHPFLDGNGRLGRILIPMVLRRQEFASHAPIDISRKFKEHQANYYAQLQSIHQEGDWEEWLWYFAACIKDAAQETTSAINWLISTVQKEYTFIREQAPNRQVKSILRVYSEFLNDPVIALPTLSTRLALAYNTTSRAVEWLVSHNLVRQSTLRASRNRMFEYVRYREALK